MKHNDRFCCAGMQAGVALIAVMWMVAALSLVITGLVYAVRGELRITSTAADSAVAAAVGDAAISIVLQRLVADRASVQGLTEMDAVFENQPIRVYVAPLNGYINPIKAPQTLLTDLFIVAGELPRAQAEALAAELVAARSGNQARLEAPEDLMPWLGGDEALYARLSPLITTSSGGSGRVNPFAAPLGVLTVLAGGDAGLAARIAASRQVDGAMADTTLLPQAHIERSVVPQYRLEAHVPLTDGGTLLRIRVVDLNGVAEDGTPWRILEAHRAIEPAVR